MNYCFIHDCFKNNVKGTILCGKCECEAGRGVRVNAKTWHPKKKA